MADLYTYRGNRGNPGLVNPYVFLGRFAAGSSATVERGAVIEINANVWTELNADQSMAGVIAVAAEEIKTTSAAGLYPIYVPRPGDIWEYALTAASNPSQGADLYWISAQTVSVTPGSNVLANVVDHGGFVHQQGRADVGDVADRGDGSTIFSVNRVLMSFVAASSYYAALHG